MTGDELGRCDPGERLRAMLTDDVALEVASPLVHAMKVAQRNGQPFGPAARAFAVSLLELAMSARGRKVASTTPPPAPSPTHRIVTSREAAARLGRTDRHIRRLAHGGAFPGARKVGDHWLIPEEAIDEHRNDRHR